ncbi:hypothetical protein [Streptomyces sp. NPDC020298]|uniref:hypothetical protein n=1 Tax=unclassified Streptomyces TaxID=2593676 RepID=UPI0033CFA71A
MNQPTAPSVFAEPWPSKVIARYATVAGATVDLMQLDSATRSKCLGCGSHEDHAIRDYYYSHGSREPVYFANRDKADREAHKWAQAHAEMCRALPKPGVAR